MFAQTFSLIFRRHDRRPNPVPAGGLSKNNGKPTRGGIAVTELAIGLPIVLLVAMGTMEMCTIIRLRQKLKMIAYEGARVGILPDAGAENVDWQCTTLCTEQSIESATIELTPADPSSLESGDWFQVSVAAPFTANSLTGAWMINAFTLDESVTLQKP
ncbi:MAG: TadE family protein [Rhodopirellula sp. JB044]|uniref:TadE family protein n=1 Tax=Rhodopirellula sp. JB044 TaxID=3342844 RepID=UPI00370A0E09